MKDISRTIEQINTPIMLEVMLEIYSQTAKYPSSYKRPNSDWLCWLGEEFGEVCMALYHRDSEIKHSLRSELIQIAAIAVRWIAVMDNR